MQTWKIKGQVYTLSQIQELRKQGLDPRKDDIVMKFVTNVQPEQKKEETKAPVTGETEQQEFERLKASKAWLRAETKDRYNELKSKFINL